MSILVSKSSTAFSIVFDRAGQSFSRTDIGKHLFLLSAVYRTYSFRS